MKVVELRTFLESQYDLICFEDLAGLRLSHNAAFNLFKMHHRVEYQPNQRLVLYSKHVPEQEFLNHLQLAIQKIDISNWFILIVTPVDITSNLEIAAGAYGNSDVVISNLVVDIEDSNEFGPKHFAVNKAMCPAPFAEINIHQNTHYMVCCKSAIMQTNEPKVNILEKFNNKVYQSLRTEFKNGNQPSYCQKCWDDEKNGAASLRHHMTNKHSLRTDFEFIDHPKIKGLTISPSVECNFACRICNSSLSTKIAREEIKFAETAEQKEILIKSYQQLVNNNTSLDSIKPVLPTIESLHILGGEPFLWSELDNLVDYCVEQDFAKNISIAFNTNGSFFPKNFPYIVEQFKSTEVLLSIDNTNRRFEIERGGKWTNVRANIEKFVSYKGKNVKIKLAPTINIQNILYLNELVKLAKELDIEILWWYLRDPDYLCIDQMTQTAKRLVVDLYKDHNISELQQLAVRMSATPAVSGDRFINYCKKIDYRRSERFDLSHCEIFYAMSHP